MVAGTLLPQAGTAYLGAYVNTSGASGGNSPQDFAAFESAIGRKLALHLHYSSFTSGFSGGSLQDDFNQFRIPVDSWDCGASDYSVSQGLQDPAITLKADQIRAYGWPVFVRFFWDANLPKTNLQRQACWDPQSGQSNGVFATNVFVTAWRHIHDIFAREHATNAIFVWSMNVSGLPPLQYYPGDAYVDWVGIDDFDSANTDFTTTYASFYATMSSLNKPIMIAETGALAPQQPSFFSQAVPALKTAFPLVRGYIYYDAIYYGNTPNENNDWRITPDTIGAFSSFAKDPYMSGHYGP